MDYLADHNPSPSFRVKPGHEQMGRRLDWSTTVGGQIAAGIQASRAREAHTRKIYIYIFIYCNYVGGHPWAINRLEAIASSNKKATRWRPSLLGWTPSLLATRTVRHFTCAQLGFKVVAWDQL